MVRRYSGALNPSQVEIVRGILDGDIGSVPGVRPPTQPTAPPPDFTNLFNDGIAIRPVAPASGPGTETFVARVDHEHEGQHSSSKRGEAPLFGDVTFSVEGLLTLVQQAQDLHFTLTLADIVGNFTHERYQLLAGHAYTFTLLYRPIGEVMVFFAGKRKQRNLHFSQGSQSVTFANTVSFIDGDLVQFSYWRDLSGGS